MKKSAILAAVLILATSNAYAYENSYAGYSVKDGDPYVRVETNKVYGYSTAQSTDVLKMQKEALKNAKKNKQNIAFLDKYQGANSINYYTAEEMKTIIGEEFSTAYFNAEYDKLALLERSQLNLKTVPTPLLDINKYDVFENKGSVVIQNQFLKDDIAKITPNIKLEKIAGQKAITIKYLYKQAYRLFNIDVTLMSANDRLYFVTNMNQDSTFFADELKQLQEKFKSKTDKNNEDKKILADFVKQAFKVENVDVATVPEAKMNKFAKQHTKLLKSLTFFEPAKVAKPLTFTDATMGKKVILPDDWYYSQTKYQFDAKTNATITAAGSVPELRNAVSAMDIDGIFTTFFDTFENIDNSNDQQANRTAFNNVAGKYLEEFSKAMKHINSGFITTSFKVKDEGLKEMLATPVSNELTVNVMLRDGLKRLKGFTNENFALHDYSYKLDFTREKANINIDTNFMALKDYNFDSKLFIGCQNDIASMMFFVKKADFTPDSSLVQQIDEWKF